MRETLTGDLPGALERLGKLPILNQEYLVGVAPLPDDPDDGQNGLWGLFFSPCGSFVAEVGMRAVRVFRVTDGDPVLVCDAKFAEYLWRPGVGTTRARFGDGNETLEIYRSFPHAKPGVNRAERWIYDAATGALRGSAMLDTADVDALSFPDDGRASHTYLHDGATYLTRHNNRIRAYKATKSGKAGAIRVDIPLRHGMPLLTAAPDGETFATANRQYLCVWRIAR